MILVHASVVKSKLSLLDMILVHAIVLKGKLSLALRFPLIQRMSLDHYLKSDGARADYLRYLGACFCGQDQAVSVQHDHVACVCA